MPETVVPVVIRRGVVFKFSGAINGNVSFMVPLYCNTNFNVGPSYWNNTWSCYHDVNWHAGVHTDKLSFTPSANMSVTGKTGLYMHIGAYLGSAIGPFIEVGPQAMVEANAGLAGKDIYYNTKGSVSLGGSVGAEIKLGTFNLGKAAIPFEFKSWELWNKELKFNAEDLLKSGSADY